MNTGSKTVALLVGIVLAGLAYLWIRTSLGWPAWLWPVIAAGALLAGLALFVWRTTKAPSHRSPTASFAEPVYVPPPDPFRSSLVPDLRLQSADPDYWFSMSVTVRWRPSGHANSLASDVHLGDVAIQSILDRAQPIAVLYSPDRHDQLRHNLAAVLGDLIADSSGSALVMGRDVTVRLSAEDEARLTEMSKIRKDHQLWEQRREHERHRRDYLAKNFFPDMGSAVVWLLATNECEITKTVSHLADLAQLTSAANNEEVPQALRSLVTQPFTLAPTPLVTEADLFTPAPPLVQWLDELTFASDEERQVFRLRLAKFLEETKQVPQADRIINWYGEAGPEDPAEPPETYED
ncbi:hypothetical protein SAMN05216275_15821 [Streptosporangium canum]|uniref:Uncharacterized protein n=1 Tax=Streptosporangium canum TaxID=324952 RepID=A0A1I4F8M8_9ACTN|nr:hypothetical protein [Streptosporangium canum]SFL13650.1 hypothetical protein SAMN05216275_15821 [Streptosporangium canum]